MTAYRFWWLFVVESIGIIATMLAIPLMAGIAFRNMVGKLTDDDKSTLRRYKAELEDSEGTLVVNLVPLLWVGVLFFVVFTDEPTWWASGITILICLSAALDYYLQRIVKDMKPL